MRKTIKIGAFAAASALALAACGSSDDTGSSGSSGDAAGKTLVVATDLPLQGTALAAQESHQQHDQALPGAAGQQGR